MFSLGTYNVEGKRSTTVDHLMREVLLVHCGHQQYWVPRHLGGPGRTHAMLHTTSAHGQHINARGQSSQSFGKLGFHSCVSLEVRTGVCRMRSADMALASVCRLGVCQLFQ